MEIDPRYDPAYQRGYVPPAAPEPESLRANPWIVVLWAFAAVFTVAGLYGVWQSNLTLATPNLLNDPAYYLWPAILQAVSPWLVAAGLASLVSAVAVHAIRWSQR